jgi:hypothetical protein
MTAKLYASYSDEQRCVKSGDVVDQRIIVHYSNIDANQTAQLAAMSTPLPMPEGWRAVVVADSDGSNYLLVSNFSGAERAKVKGRHRGRRFSIDIKLLQNHSAAYRLEVQGKRLHILKQSGL